MTTLEPEILANEDKPKSSPKLGTLAFVVSLAASAVGNVVQWRTNAAAVEKSRAESAQLKQEANKTAAEIEKLKQEQAESGERSVQSWLAELKKFDAPEDRAMVLSAAVSTTSDERVKAWAREQLNLVEQALAERRRIAEAQLAIAETAVGGKPGSALVNPQPSASSAAISPQPSVTKDPKAAAQILATRDLSRIKKAESLVINAKK